MLFRVLLCTLDGSRVKDIVCFATNGWQVNTNTRKDEWGETTGTGVQSWGLVEGRGSSHWEHLLAVNTQELGNEKERGEKRRR